MKFGLEGLRVLVTAGAAGIGLKVAQAFDADGATRGVDHGGCAALCMAGRMLARMFHQVARKSPRPFLTKRKPRRKSAGV